MSLIDVTLLDILALPWFFACWLGYGQFSKWRTRSAPSLITALRVFRTRWMEGVCRRENHQSDTAILGNLLRGAIFFASTTIFILGGLVALLGTTQRVIEVVSQLPFTGPFPVWLWELKAVMLIYIFVYAFFKFTWSAWQYNALSIIVGAAPVPTADPDAAARYVATASDMAALAGESFNHAVRAYYFSMAAMSWFLHPVALILVASLVAIVLYRREFASPTLRAMLRGVDRTATLLSRGT